MYLILQKDTVLHTRHFKADLSFRKEKKKKISFHHIFQTKSFAHESVSKSDIFYRKVLAKKASQL